jgi:hypothetical protein
MLLVVGRAHDQVDCYVCSSPHDQIDCYVCSSTAIETYFFSFVSQLSTCATFVSSMASMVSSIPTHFIH